ncbi:MAG: dTDP-4-dehydrorhamnose reductase [Lachnospiraceae bacterium]
MKIMVTGAKGQLGTDVVSESEKRGYEVIGLDVEEMDITKEEQVRNWIQQEKPDCVIHCAAYTQVDAAEEEEERCRAINAVGTGYLAKACKEADCKMIYISTDYVFDGEGMRPWETDDAPAPQNVYGQTKLEGEREVICTLQKYYIVRISWVFGMHGNNFVKTMLRLGKENKEIKVVNDQVGSPTYTPDLAVLLVDMAETEEYGIYHATNLGLCTWYQFAYKIFELAGMDDVQVLPVTSEEFPAKAKRPHNSRMNKAKLDEKGFVLLPRWEDALERFLSEYLKNR